MSDRGTIALPRDTLVNWDHTKIKLAGELGKVPTNPQLIKMMLELTDKHRSEAVEILSRIRGE